MNHVMRWCMVVMIFVLTGCATSTNNPHDPLEGMNRKVFAFNDKLDEVAIKPAAKVYKAVLPSFVQTGVGNFFGNIGDVSTALNNLLQGRIHDGMSDVTRVAVNTVFGFVGLFDVASPTGLPKHKQDFGQTLGRWGVQAGPYLVLPLLGPSTTRDAVATPVDFETNLWNYKDPVRWRNTGTAIEIVGRRADSMDQSKLLDDAALDRYEFVRDGYLQRRQGQIYPRGAEKKSADTSDADKVPPDDDDVSRPETGTVDTTKSTSDKR